MLDIWYEPIHWYKIQLLCFAFHLTFNMQTDIKKQKTKEHKGVTQGHKQAKNMNKGITKAEKRGLHTIQTQDILVFRSLCIWEY